MKYLILSIAVCLATPVFAQVTEDDYRRAESFEWSEVQKIIYHLGVEPNWLEGGKSFWYETRSEEGREFLLVNIQELESQPLFDRERLVDTLRKKLNINAKANDLPLRIWKVEPQKSLKFYLNNRNWFLDLNTYELKQVVSGEKTSKFSLLSPDSTKKVFSRNHNFWVKDMESGEEIQLSTAGGKNYEYGSYYDWFDLMEGETDTRPENFRAQWSYNSQKVLTQICDLRHAQKMYLLDYSQDDLFRPQLLGYYRGSPGDTSIVYLRPVIFDIENQQEIPIDIPPVPHFTSFGLEWSQDGEYLYGGTWDRGYKSMRIIQVNAKDGTVQVLYSEKSDTRVDFRMFDMILNEKSGKLFFTSERSGWNQLYAIDLKTRNLKPVTQGEYVIWDIVHTDEEDETFYFLASGKSAKCNPYFTKLYRVNFDGTSLKELTRENLHHEVSFSPDGQSFVDNYSSPKDPPVSVLRNASNGKVLMQIGRCDAERLFKKGWETPEVFEAVGRDGRTPIYGALWKPVDFDPAKSYPIIDASYTGPHTHVFPESFTQVVRSGNQALAELGFIVMAVDGMGTIGRGKAFSDVSYKRMGFNLEDHVRAIRQLGEIYPWIDTTRVGIFGHSAGGYDAAHALLQYPDFYKVGVSSSADHDFRMEKAWWPEMYMGWPVDSAYHDQSNITMAGNLKGKLLITHGGLDHNVNPSATFKLAEALVRNGKEFDMLIFPGQQHSYQGKVREYFVRKRWNYFVRHLLGKEPIWDLDKE